MLRIIILTINMKKGEKQQHIEGKKEVGNKRDTLTYSIVSSQGHMCHKRGGK